MAFHGVHSEARAPTCPVFLNLCYTATTNDLDPTTAVCYELSF